MSQQAGDGFKWIEAQVYTIANELSIQLDRAPEWVKVDQLNFKMAVEVAGRREILKLWGPHIDDSQGGDNPATGEVRAKLQDQIRAFLEGFVPPQKRIGF